MSTFSALGIALALSNATTKPIMPSFVKILNAQMVNWTRITGFTDAANLEIDTIATVTKLIASGSTAKVVCSATVAMLTV